MKKRCASCPNWFVQRHPNQVTCLDTPCRTKRRRMIANKWHRENREKEKASKSYYCGVYHKRKKIKREVIFPRKTKKKVARPDGTIKVNVPSSLCSCGQSFSDTFKLWVHIFQGKPIDRKAILAYDKIHG